ncbi:hypothetical protein [Parvularcula sp. IMCC14364]|uniref:hypothetical protein n=1 Tax=Parvularcula sp. IMCC14364 TaxID=3067902 RepID=UPI002740B024|nr:hypothetical protein [Parvularcula sp. IMCC14364]
MTTDNTKFSIPAEDVVKTSQATMDGGYDIESKVSKTFTVPSEDVVKTSQATMDGGYDIESAKA